MVYCSTLLFFSSSLHISILCRSLQSRARTVSGQDRERRYEAGELGGRDVVPWAPPRSRAERRSPAGRAIVRTCARGIRPRGPRRRNIAAILRCAGGCGTHAFGTGQRRSDSKIRRSKVSSSPCAASAAATAACAIAGFQPSCVSAVFASTRRIARSSLLGAPTGALVGAAAVVAASALSLPRVGFVAAGVFGLTRAGPVAGAGASTWALAGAVAVAGLDQADDIGRAEDGRFRAENGRIRVEVGCAARGNYLRGAGIRASKSTQMRWSWRQSYARHAPGRRS